MNINDIDPNLTQTGCLKLIEPFETVAVEGLDTQELIDIIFFLSSLVNATRVYLPLLESVLSTPVIFNA